MWYRGDEMKWLLLSGIEYSLFIVIVKIPCAATPNCSFLHIKFHDNNFLMIYFNWIKVDLLCSIARHLNITLLPQYKALYVRHHSPLSCSNYSQTKRLRLTCVQWVVTSWKEITYSYACMFIVIAYSNIAITKQKHYIN